MAGQIGYGMPPMQQQPPMQGGNDWLRGLAQQLAARRAQAQGSAPQQTGITPDGRPVITYTPPQATGLFGMPMPFQAPQRPITAEVGAMLTPTGAAPNAPAIMPAGPLGPNGAPVAAVTPAGSVPTPIVPPAAAPPIGGPVAPVARTAAPTVVPGQQGGPQHGWGQHRGFGHGGPFSWLHGRMGGQPWGQQWGQPQGQPQGRQSGPIVPQQNGFAAGEPTPGSKPAFAPGWTDRMGGAFAAPRQSAASRGVAPTQEPQTNPQKPENDDDEDDY